MFRFTAQGRIGKIEELKAKTLRISIAADRLAEGRDGQYTKTEWLRCVSFDADLNAEMLTQLDKGDSVTFEGRIVPTVWLKGEQKIYDNTFEITRYQRPSRGPKRSRRVQDQGRPDRTRQLKRLLTSVRSRLRAAPLFQSRTRANARVRLVQEHTDEIRALQTRNCTETLGLRRAGARHRRNLRHA